MKEYLRTIMLESATLTLETILLNIVAAAVFGMAIYLSYWYTHAGTAYSKKFNVSLITLTILTGTVMTVIGNNIALSLGICCGVSDYYVAAVGSTVVFLVLLLFGRVRNESRILLIIRGTKDRSMDMEQLVFHFFDGRPLLKVKNTTNENVELIYEMTRAVYQNAYKKENDVIDQLYALGGVEYVNFVTQSDEITG